MGRGYRRGSAVCHTSFTIDKLFKECNNKPSAARSAGTVGKWGITSFTTIRGSGFGSSKQPPKAERKETVSDGYSFNTDSAKPKDEPPKPKKFFKSRNTGASAAVEQSAKPIEKEVKKIKDDGGNKKVSPKSSPVSDGEYKPPIVLRIFKGTSCLVADGSDSGASPPVQQSPRGDKSPGSKGRRRSTQEEPSWSPKGRRRSAVEDTPPPISKRPKRACRDPAIQNIMSQLLSDDEGDESGFESQILSQPVALISASTVEDNISEDSIPLASTEFYRQGSANKENELKSVQVIDKDLALEAQGQSLLSGATFEPMSLERENSLLERIVEPCSDAIPDGDSKMEAEQEMESDEDTDSQEQPDSGVMMTSQMDGGGLKLVIKKAPDPHPHSDLQTDSETVKVKREPFYILKPVFIHTIT